MNDPVLLVDASIYVFRAYYSVRDSMLDSDQRPSNAVWGFTGFLCDLLQKQPSAHVLVAFDESLNSSFRNRIYPPYKANRETPPADLEWQFQGCRRVAEALGLRCAADSELEADDLIGGALEIVRAANGHALIVSADKDLAQLVSERDHWWDFARDLRLDPQGVAQKFGVLPAQIPDLLALAGDSVDNIPGVRGVGPKTAAALIAHFGSLAELYQRLEEVPFLRLRGARSVYERLREHQAAAELALQLTRISIDRSPVADVPALARQPVHRETLAALCEHYRFGPMTRSRLREVSRLV